MMKKLLLIIVAMASLLSCSTVAVTGRKQLLLVSNQEVMSLSNNTFRSYMSKAKLSTNRSNTEMVKRVGTKIAIAVEHYLRDNGLEQEIKNYAWEFHLVQDNTPNAFCLPGGKIVVNEGILPITKTEEGLAIVVGHEVGHAVAKHSAERLSNQMLTQYGGAILGTIMQNKSSEAQFLAQQIYGLGAQYGVMLPHSRRNESEADHLGLVFAAMAGYNPQAAIGFWQRMAAAGGESVPEFMSTHPSDETRISRIQKLMPEAMKYYKGEAKTSSKASKIIKRNTQTTTPKSTGKKYKNFKIGR